MDQHGFARYELALQEQRVEGGEKHLGDRGCLLEVEALGHGHELALVDGDQRGVAAPAEQRHHAVARAPLRDALADALDDAGHLEPEQVLADAGRRGVAAAALHQVGAVERGGVDRDQGVLGPRVRVRELAQLEDVGIAGLGDNGGAHA